ncbi:GTPase [Actinomarinicola tropica]|uniref:ABC transporter n=1 Tax=Actinomarinicola tropica TaxID=2789776 RepID=A0A5Q2RMK1_9ACTN|nr:GTPase [Actinomarinicola tropica]QGG95100.1 ABC transporter [Actinomarinicola tropica]
MTPRARRSGPDASHLRDRLDALDAVLGLAEAGPGRLPDDVATRAREVQARADARLRHGSSRTVVALAGATGSGKSTLFNSLVGAEVATVGVRRPTTARPQAAVFDAAGGVGEEVAALLDWLDVDRRHVVARDAVDDLDGLVLLDLPDHDSTEAHHRAEVDRLAEAIDVFVWVVDPQKYADAALHQRYLRRYATHAAVTLVVLNQVDLVAADQRRALVQDVERLLADDGLTGVRVLTTSAIHDEGTAELRREVAARVAEQRAAVARLDADLDWTADQLAAHVGDVEPPPLGARAGRDLVDAFARAAGADAVADAVAAAHRRRAGRAMGWPVTRWLGGLRPDPLRRLGLERPAPSEGTTTIGRTSRPGPSAVSIAAAHSAARDVSAAASTGLPEPWRQRVEAVVTARRDDVADALDQAVASTRLPSERPRWWALVGALQWLLAGAMAVGVVWLVALGVVAWLRLPEVPTPEVGAIPWPTLLAVGGAVAGLLVSVVARAVAGVGARRRGAVARRRLSSSTAAVARELVLDPLGAELEALAELRRRVLALRR